VQELKASERVGKWWENVDKKKEKKWKTLQHNGVYFPPLYESLPSNVKILYKGKPTKLDGKNTKNKFNISAEEAAVFFSQMIDRDERLKSNKKRARYSEDPVFIKNFWKDWKEILGKNSEIKNFKDVNFSPLVKYLYESSENKKKAKKATSKEEKVIEKEQKEAIKKIYGYAIVDGIKIPMDYAVEIPGLYQGHGNHPLRGAIKKRLEPSDITLNISKKNIPKCFIHGKPCKWGFIVEDPEVTWLASWKNPITGESTYKGLKRIESHFVCGEDIEKFNKARKLDQNIEKIRKKYKKDLNSSQQDVKQLATAVYLLDELAIRPGTEKDESKEAGTLGLTTLKCNNVKFEGSDKITIDFTGKSSIRFTKNFKVNSAVYKNLQTSCSGKKNGKLFPKINATSLNGYLKTLLPGLTAKVFRTWKASSILQKQLEKNVPKMDDLDHEKKILYDKVNIEVALALNHKRMADSDVRVEKIENKIKELKQKKKTVNTDKQKATVQKSIDLQEMKLIEAKENISLSTSKVNYLDPRITVSWCKKGDTPIEKIYNKTQLKKFVWAMSTDPKWKF